MINFFSLKIQSKSAKICSKDTTYFTGLNGLIVWSYSATCYEKRRIFWAKCDLLCRSPGSNAGRSTFSFRICILSKFYRFYARHTWSLPLIYVVIILCYVLFSPFLIDPYVLFIPGPISYPTLIPCLVQSLFYIILSSSPMSYTAQIPYLVPMALPLIQCFLQPWSHVLFSPDSMSESAMPMSSLALVSCLFKHRFHVLIGPGPGFSSALIPCFPQLLSHFLFIQCLHHQPWSHVLFDLVELSRKFANFPTLS